MYARKGYAKAENHGMWKGTEAGYQALHVWIRTHYGKADCCENLECSGKSKEYQWALKPGKVYSRNIGDYMKMCRSCHRKMDITEETKKKISISLQKYVGCKVMSCPSPHLSRGYCSHHYNTIVRVQ